MVFTSKYNVRYARNNRKYFNNSILVRQYYAEPFPMWKEYLIYDTVGAGSAPIFSNCHCTDIYN
jgi:hypothetical protein